MTRPVCPLQSLRHCSCAHLQETLNVVGKVRHEVTNETTIEDVVTPHGDDVTDDPVLPDSKAEDELVPGAGDRTKPLPPYRHATATECVVVISWEILVTNSK